MKRAMFAILFALAQPPASALAAGDAADDDIVVGLSLPLKQPPVFTAMRTGAGDAADQLGARIWATYGNWTAGQQTRDVETLVAGHVRGLVVNPFPISSIVPAIEGAARAGIPVATIVERVDTDRTLVQVACDDIEGGRLAARFIVERLGNKGSVLEIEGPAGSSMAADRKAGFEEVIKASGVKLLASEPADLDRAKARNAMYSMAGKHPRFDAVFAANDEMILGSIEAVTMAGQKPSSKVIVGFDATPEALQALRNGTLAAIIECSLAEQGARAVRYLVDHIRTGAAPPGKMVRIAPRLLTQAP